MSRGNDALLCCGAAAGLVLAGCMLGGDGDDELTPYERASISVPDPVGPADGLTGVEVHVSGDIGSRLVLEVVGNGSFLNPDPGAPTEKTVFLTDMDGQGHATAEVISSRPGEVAVAFKPDPLRGPQEVRFLPVVFAAGTPKATRLHPGLVETEICFAVNTAQGVLATNALVDPEAAPEEASQGDEGAADLGDEEEDDGFALEAPAPGVQATAPIGEQPPAGLDCPAADAALDEIGWVGYAKMFVRTDLEHAMLSLDYRKDVGSPNLYNREIELFLDPFPGYEVIVGDPLDNFDYVEMTLQVAYLPLDDLGGEPAEGVEITQRCIPDCPALLGTSAGGPDDPIITDANGEVTLFFDPLEAGGTWVWYLNLSGIEQRQPDLTF